MFFETFFFLSKNENSFRLKFDKNWPGLQRFIVLLSFHFSEPELWTRENKRGRGRGTVHMSPFCYFFTHRSCLLVVNNSDKNGAHAFFPTPLVELNSFIYFVQDPYNLPFLQSGSSGQLTANELNHRTKLCPGFYSECHWNVALFIVPLVR